MSLNPARLVLVLCAPLFVLLSGSTEVEGDIKAELNSLTATLPAKIPALPPGQAFEPAEYSGVALRDPFVPSGAGGGAGGQPAPDLARPKEILESYPLDSIKMVGSIHQSGKLTAIVQVGSVLHRVIPGNYLGTDYGRVTGVTTGGIEIRETIQDANNIWVHRLSSIKLEENEGKK